MQQPYNYWRQIRIDTSRPSVPPHAVVADPLHLVLDRSQHLRPPLYDLVQLPDPSLLLLILLLSLDLPGRQFQRFFLSRVKGRNIPFSHHGRQYGRVLAGTHV